MRASIVVQILAIAAIAGLEALAINKGLNGTTFAVATAVIGGIAGYSVKDLRALIAKR